MKRKTIEKINNAKVGDTIETKKYRYFVLESNKNCANNGIKCCFYNSEMCYNIKCYFEYTQDNKYHTFKREIEEKI